jgi:hypothetical protein
MQYQSAKYRWVRDPFPFDTNRGIQCDGTVPPGEEDASPEEQSRLDDTDADNADVSPYRP